MTIASMTVLGAAALLCAILIACAILDHADALREMGWQQIATQARRIYLDEDTWRSVTEQIAADALSESVEIAAFCGVSAGRASWLRFVLRDGRALVFATARWVPGCYGRGRRLTLKQHTQAIGELHALWTYFAHAIGQDGAVPRHAAWHVLPLQVPQARQPRPVRMQLAAPLSSFPAFHSATRTGMEKLI